MDSLAYFNNNIKGDNEFQNKHLIFQSNKNLFGVAISNIIEIIEYKQPTQVPSLSKPIKGLLNLRGKVIPIIDLNLLLSDKNSIINRKTCIIIFDHLVANQSEAIGILVDNVLDVIEIEPNKIEKTLDLSVKTEIDYNLIKNVVILDDKIVIILDLNTILKHHNFN